MRHANQQSRRSLGDARVRRAMWRAVSLASICAATLRILATGIVPAAAQAPQQHAWLEPGLLQKAKAEGAFTVYGSMNEAEALPLWKLFEDDSGIKVSYVRSSDTQIMARVAIEERARQRS